MNTLLLKRSLGALGAAVVLGGIAVSVVGAQAPSPTRPARPAALSPGQSQSRDQAHQKFLDALAAKLGIASDKLKQAITDTRKDLGWPEKGPGFGPGHDGPGGHGGPGFRGPGPRVPLDAAAKALGITADQLRQELPGKTLTDVAKAHNVDAKKVADALKAGEAARIDQAVADGRLTADRAQQAKQEASTRIDQLMTRQVPAGAPGAGPVDGRGPRGGPGGPGGHGGPRPASPPAA